ncbi:glycosyltransferase [Puniceicoccaceae bacterium K14]|nr:glycosyltransferase [Puniceicoccaceae bacterium K14]
MIQLLSDVYDQKDATFEVIVVDDRSTDDSVKEIKKQFPAVRVFVNAVNSGPSVTRNRGIKEAIGEIIVGFDSDVTVPDKFCLKKIVEEFKNFPHIDALAFRLLQPDQTTDDFARWWHPLDCRAFSKQKFLTDYFSGTGYAFVKAKIEEAGAFPEYLYMHYEEVILALCAIDNGQMIQYTPSIEVVHHEGQVSRRTEIKAFYKHRNQLLLAYLHYPVFKALKYVLPRTAKAFLDSITNNSVKSYFKALRSAPQVVKDHSLKRAPIKRKTLKILNSYRKATVSKP